MMKLCTHFSFCYDSIGPMYCHTHFCSTIIRTHLLSPFVRCVEQYCPASCHMVVSFGAAPFVHFLQHVFNFFLNAVEISHFAKHSVAATFGTCTIVSVNEEYQGVVQFAHIFNGFHYFSNMVVCKINIRSKHFNLVPE